ncbi:phage tail assembly protein [Nocardioides alkalitolerans]|uniref:phage tail assembly protein n=1 Tax=Nocardioides alkalitolerans TaxID=281714 RepID=UPI00040EC231|nr:phage tail assembly protein [Nocardioides alkalitolerans]
MAFSLDDIRNAAKKKFGSAEFEIDGQTFNLRNALKLSDEERDSLFSKDEKNVDEDGEPVRETTAETRASLEHQIRTLSDRKDLADRLLEEIGGDLTELAQVMAHWTEETQAGEA